jgi:hypothetical protein
LFGGPLGLLHRHVTGAMPIRRDTRDPAYLITLKAYVAELLRTHDFFFYPEGGRSYSGEMKVPKTGLMHAALHAEHPHMVVLPTAVAYDVVLEDHVLARQRVKRTQRAFSREFAEMVRYAVGYRSRAFVTFGKPISVDGVDVDSRRAVLDLTHAVMKAIGRIYKVLPTAVVAAAMRPSIARRDWRRGPTRSSTRCAPTAPTWGPRAARRRLTRPWSRSKRAASWSSSADACACAIATSCGTTPARSTTFSNPPPAERISGARWSWTAAPRRFSTHSHAARS